jgi:hypothetical protein
MDIKKSNLNMLYNEKIKNILIKIIICPSCDGKMDWDITLICNDCGENYTIDEKNGQIDLRLKSSKKILHEQVLDSNYSFNIKNKNKKSVYNFKFGYNSRNKIFTNFGKNLNKKQRKPVNKLYSWLPKNGRLALDIGSATDEKNKSYLEYAGFIYISIDYDSPNAMILADAHALPFCENSFDCITNLAVMEHIEFPFIAGRELYRILNINGRMLGVVAFLQQHHMSSWYHFTHFGVYSWLTNSGFSEKKIKIDAADKKYHGIFNTASLIGLPILIKNLFLYPIYFLHRILWKIYAMKNGDNFEKVRHLQTTGAIHFIADK